MLNEFYLILIALMISIINSASSPIFIAPLNLQASQFYLEVNWTNIVSGEEYNVPYRDGFTISGTGKGCIALSSLLLDPTANFEFSCRSLTISATSIKVKCQTNANTYVATFAYSYFVFDHTSYNTLINSMLAEEMTHDLISQTGKVVLSTPLDASYSAGSQYKCFIYLRGLQYTNTQKNYGLNQTCSEVNGKYQIEFDVLEEVQNSKLHISLIGVNTLEMVINQGYILIENGQVYMSGFSENVLTLPFTHKNETTFLTGLKSVSLQKSIQYIVYNFYVNNYPSIVYAFSNQSKYDEVELFWISKASCSSPTQTFDQVELKCVENRNNCSSYYQKLTVPVTSFIYKADIHSSYKIFAYCEPSFIQFMRYNGTDYVQFYTISTTHLGSGVNNMKCNRDYSRVAFIGVTGGFHIYAWNGTDYVSEYVFSGEIGVTRIFIDFDISEDFKRVVIISRLVSTNNYVLTTLIYNTTSLAYKISESIMPDDVSRIFIRDNGEAAYAFSSKYLYHMTMSIPLGRFISDYDPFLIEEAAGVSIDDVAVATESGIIAIEYSRKLVGLNKVMYGVKILEISALEKKFKFGSRISPEIFSPFSNNPHKLIFSQFGKKLILKPVSGSYLAIFVKTGPYVNDPFRLLEIIGKVPGSTYSSSITNYALTASEDFEFILSGDTANSLVLYYCKSIILKANKTYHIPKASVLSGPIEVPIIIPENKPEVNKEMEQLEEELSNAEITNKVMLALGIVSLVGILILSVQIIYIKIQANTASNVMVNSSIDVNNPTRMNLDFEGNDQSNNFASLRE